MLLVLISLKYMKFIWSGSLAEGVSPSPFVSVMLLVPLGLSYYTFTLIGYMVDVYNGIAKVQMNFFKLLTFGMYAPVLVSGPILQYREISGDFFAEHNFDLRQITFGMQRMLWGFFKKLVIAERLGVMVSTVYDDPVTYSGGYVWLGILCFTIQLYSDFSGLMDIVLGISQCLGFKLPENFNTPFFAKTVAEYWRRWHITLGVWFKEYLFYPILRTSLHRNIQNKLKAAYAKKGDEKKAKKRSKQISTYIAMFVLWLIIGLWHGGNMTFVIGSGLLHWFYIVMEEVLEPVFKKLWEKIKVNPDGKVLNALRILRTFILVNIGNAFFRAPSVGAAFKLLGCGLGIGTSGSTAEGLIGSFVTAVSSNGIRAVQEIGPLGLTYTDMVVLAFSILILLIVDIMKTKTDVRKSIAAQPIVIRYIIWLALLFYVILMGQYGPGYDAAAFIYQGF